MNTTWAKHGLEQQRAMWRRACTKLATLALAAGACFPSAAQEPPTAQAPRNSALVNVQRVGSPPLRVMDIAVSDRTIWVATRHSGVYGLRGKETLHLDLGHPLPSAVVWQVEPISGASGAALLVGTSQGAVRVELSTSHTTALKPQGEDGGVYAHNPADVVRVSPTDGQPLFQTQLPANKATPSTTWRLDPRAAVRFLDLPDGATITSTARDRAGGCLQLAGTVVDARQQKLWYASLCNENSKSRRVLVDTKTWPDVLAISAVAFDPVTGRPVLAIVRDEPGSPTGRRYQLAELTPEGALRLHCSGVTTSEEVTGLLIDAPRRRLVVAIYGKGVQAIDCQSPGEREQLGTDVALLKVTTLASDPDDLRRLLVGTDTGLYALQSGSDDRATTWTASALLVAQAPVLPANALPSDISGDAQHVLLTSPRQGVLELAKSSEGWRIERRWSLASETVADAGSVSAVVYGDARYTDEYNVSVLVRSQGLYMLSDAGTRWLDRETPESNRSVLGYVVDTGRGIWSAMGSTPATDSAGVYWHPNDGSERKRTIRLRDAMTEPNGSMLIGPQNSLWAATRAGVIQVDTQGKITRLTNSRVQSLFQNRDDPTLVGVVGASIERWTGSGFEPVRIDIPSQATRSLAPLGHPIDLIIDRSGRWAILFSSGQLVVLDRDRHFEAVLGPLDGIPATAKRLFDLRGDRGFLIGSDEEGLFAVSR